MKVTNNIIGLLAVGLLLFSNAAGGDGIDDGQSSFTPAITDSALPGLNPDNPLHPLLTKAYAGKGKDYVPRTHHLNEDGSPVYTNRLILQSSPYLLQHAHNPVNWYPWSDEAFERARAEGKLILMSIGYSTCHWCHVMERESFEDVEIAAYLNQNYIAIKVDREERPDIDSIYMTAVQMLTGRGGWPMTTILTPDRVPVFGATYIPPRDGARGRSKGFLTVLREMRQVAQQEPARLESVAQDISRRMRESSANSRPGDVPGAEAIGKAANALAASFDPAWGGFGNAPKFPRPAMLELLTRYYRRTGDEGALKMVEVTLEKMAAGGMHDQVGGGFHRYSTDGRWLVPHFEKMLYDNAQLLAIYLEGYQLTQRDDFATVARSTADYVLREMTGKGGGFYSATDADSPDGKGHEEEGLFFTWTPAELDALLGEQQARLVAAYYGVTARGNFEGRSILNTPRPLATVAETLEMTPAALQQALSTARGKMYQARAKRLPPLLDDKVLTSWNALMISSLSRAALVLDEPRYSEAATEAMTFLLDNLVVDGRLKRSYKDGMVNYDAFLDDYAFTVMALLDLYETTYQVRWLTWAKKLQAVLDLEFSDPAAGGYFFTGKVHQALMTREKPDYDGAEPSGNSVALLNLLRLEQFTGDEQYRKTAERGFATFQRILQYNGRAVPKMITALDYYLDRPAQVVIVTPRGGDAGPLLAELRKVFLPNKILAVFEEGKNLAAQATEIPLVTGKVARDGKATAYVCRNKVCDLPTTDPHIFAKQLKSIEPLQENGSEGVKSWQRTR